MAAEQGEFRRCIQTANTDMSPMKDVAHLRVSAEIHCAPWRGMGK